MSIETIKRFVSEWREKRAKASAGKWGVSKDGVTIDDGYLDSNEDDGDSRFIAYAANNSDSILAALECLAEALQNIRITYPEEPKNTFARDYGVTYRQGIANEALAKASALLEGKVP